MNLFNSLIGKIGVLSLLLAAAGCTSAKDSSMLIDQIPLLTPEPALAADQFPQQQTALKQALEQHWQGEYRIRSERFYRFKDEPKWVVLEKRVDNHVRDDLGGKREYLKSGRPGISGVGVWKVGMLRPERVAVAMADEALPDGSVLYGLFEVEKP